MTSSECLISIWCSDVCPSGLIGLFVLDLELLAGLLARPLLGCRGLRLLRLGRRLRLWRAARAARLQQRLRLELRAAGGADDGRLRQVVELGPATLTVALGSPLRDFTQRGTPKVSLFIGSGVAISLIAI